MLCTGIDFGVQSKGSTKLRLQPHTEAMPDSVLELEYMHGYRGTDCKNNVLFNSEGRLVYSAAAVCVVHDLHGKKQRFFMRHTDPIYCMALHDDGRTIATGAPAPLCGPPSLISTTPLVALSPSLSLSHTHTLSLTHARARRASWHSLPSINTSSAR